MTFDPKEARALVERLPGLADGLIGKNDLSVGPHMIRLALFESRDALTAALTEIERLQNPPEEYCAKCGAPKSNHPYRHLFVSGAIKGADQ